eukprot:TRINITY_DN3838_c0_g2_i1.p1 TRINITY_DN3838_c0_g2~~TRINITY_DN3838_c0_g2_i1.p1  ORF type:complete len:205 (-),score=12.09 TRINITY_DN3838_c0_g2_i1:374-988(-)
MLIMKALICSLLLTAAHASRDISANVSEATARPTAEGAVKLNAASRTSMAIADCAVYDTRTSQVLNTRTAVIIWDGEPAQGRFAAAGIANVDGLPTPIVPPMTVDLKGLCLGADTSGHSAFVKINTVSADYRTTTDVNKVVLTGTDWQGKLVQCGAWKGTRFSENGLSYYDAYNMGSWFSQSMVCDSVLYCEGFSGCPSQLTEG